MVATESTDQMQIKLRLGYTLSDAIHARRLHYSKMRRYWTDKIVGVLLILWGGFFVKGYYDPQSQQFMIGGDWVFFALLIFLMLAGIILIFDLASIAGVWSGHRKRLQSSPRQTSFVFEDSGAEYTIDTPESQIHLRVGWSEFKRIEEDKDIILLVTNENRYWVIPKRHFLTPADLNRFQHLIYNKII
jgi:hypothetical protein